MQGISTSKVRSRSCAGLRSEKRLRKEALRTQLDDQRTTNDGKVEAHETTHNVEIVVVESRYGRFLTPGRPPFCSLVNIIGQATIRLATPVDGRPITGGPHY